MTNLGKLELSVMGPEKCLLPPSVHRPWGLVLALHSKKVRVGSLRLRQRKIPGPGLTCGPEGRK